MNKEDEYFGDKDIGSLDNKLICNDKKENADLNQILNTVVHVFHSHNCGTWVSFDKPRYAKLLLPFIQKHPSLIERILNMKNRAINMVLYKAIEMGKLELDE